MRITIPSLLVTALAVSSCGGSGSSAPPPGFSGLDSGTAANEVTQIRLDGTTNESTTIAGQGYQLDLVTPMATGVSDSNGSGTSFTVAVDLDDVDLPADPNDQDVAFDLNVGDPAQATVTYTLEAER